MTRTPLSRRLLPIAFLLCVVAVGIVLVLIVAHLRLPAATSTTGSRSDVDWPGRGQAALALADGPVLTSGRERPAPIASLTKIMTALIILEQAPIRSGEPGFGVTITPGDVRDFEQRRAGSESLLRVRSGQTISERDALSALLLPSANNIAHLLAVRAAGSEQNFATIMTERARSLGMRNTRYADASGIDPATTSTAADQTVLARVAMRNTTFAWLVRQEQLQLSTGEEVSNTNRLLDHGRYFGVKTGSTTPAGGCFVFATQREIDGRQTLVIGAVLGQRGEDLLTAAFDATEMIMQSVGRPSRP